MQNGSLYHILYADDLRLNSLDAQLHGKVPLALREEESLAHESNTGGEAGVTPFAKFSGGATKTNLSSQSTEYTFRDARYFDVLEKLGVDLNSPEQFKPGIVDGNIHVLKGQLKISGSTAIAPLVGTMQALLPEMIKNPSPFGLSAEKSEIKTIRDMEKIVKLIPKMPLPSSFRLSMQGESVSGPIEDAAVRMGMGNMMILFGGKLPFEWLVVGYLYPAEPSTGKSPEPNDINGAFESLALGMKSLFVPTSGSIMLPLLILR